MKKKKITNKEETKKGLKNREKGITLVALIVTIIVLLILAGVSIAMLTGDNGILNQAKKAKEETEKASVIEHVQVDILGKQTEGNGIDAETLKEILNKYFTNVPTDANSITIDLELKANEEYGGYNILLSDIYRGKINIKGITPGNLTDDQKKELYGAYVTNYDCSSNDAIETTAPGKWMIFHIDDDNIYLISSDYINIDYCPTKDGATVTKGSKYPKGACFNNIYTKYTGSIDIAKEYQWLNSSYFEILNSTQNSNANIKSVAYMLDTNAWSGFKGTDADYAIGGPTIELLFEAYNKKYGTNYMAKANSSYGYQIGSDGNATDYDLYLSNLDIPYVITSQKNAYAYWIASPCAANYTWNIFVTYYDGGIGSGNINENTYTGFRPLVSLKSDVQLKKTGDNTYEIIK